MVNSSHYLPVIRLSSIKPPVVRLVNKPPVKVDAIAVLIHQKVSGIPVALKPLNEELCGALAKAIDLGDFNGKPGTIGVYPGHKSIRRLFLVGLGKPEAMNADQLRWAAAIVARKAIELKLKTVVLHLESLAGKLSSDLRLLEAMSEGITLGCFKYNTFKNIDDKDNDAIAKSTLPLPTFDIFVSPSKMSDQFNQAVTTGISIATAANYARFISCHPGNVVDPGALIQEARALAAATGLSIEIIDHKKARTLGMGGLLSVGQGSVSPPALILLEHKPKSLNRSTHPQKTVVLVGKAVTFDTGGISIKPAADMGMMKFDKCGGMAVLGAMKAIADLKLPVHVIGAIPTAENSVDALAYRPGDIIRMFNGKTVEVTNTDAEGRLILADALSYVCQRYHPHVLINLATLTGGVVVALGSVYAGLMSNHDALSRDLEDAGTFVGEWLWRLPLHERYAELLESAHADITNSGGREGHPIQGGMFLSNFVPPKTPWAHLDIAGMSHPKKNDRYFIAHSANAFGTRLLVEYLRRKVM